MHGKSVWASQTEWVTTVENNKLVVQHAWTAAWSIFYKITTYQRNRTLFCTQMCVFVKWKSPLLAKGSGPFIGPGLKYCNNYQIYDTFWTHFRGPQAMWPPAGQAFDNFQSQDIFKQAWLLIYKHTVALRVKSQQHFTKLSRNSINPNAIFKKHINYNSGKPNCVSLRAILRQQQLFNQVRIALCLTIWLMTK